MMIMKMKTNKMIILSLFIILIFTLFETSTGYPMDKLTTKTDLKDGKFNDGNHVNVKRFADGSDGIELLSAEEVDYTRKVREAGASGSADSAAGSSGSNKPSTGRASNMKYSINIMYMAFLIVKLLK